MSAMAELYAKRVTNGLMTFDEVPRQMKQPVADILVENGLAHLVTDPAFLPTTEA